jgi:hypothetical protein
MDVEQQRARCVADVGNVRAATGKVPDEPAVDGAERQLAALGARTGAVDVLEQPRDFGARKIGIDLQSAQLAHPVFDAAFAQVGAGLSGPSILPDDRRRDRRAGRAFPDQRRLPLIGDADRGQIPGRGARPLQGVARARELRRPDFAGVVLDPARLRKMLPKLLLRGGHRTARPVEHDRA